MTSAASQQFFETFPPDVARAILEGRPLRIHAAKVSTVRDGAGADTPDTFAQTFPCTHAREKVTANVSVVSGEDVPPSVFATINTYTWRGGLEKKGARCSVKGCDRKPEWVNASGEWPLCSAHYNELSLRAKREVRP